MPGGPAISPGAVFCDASQAIVIGKELGIQNPGCRERVARIAQSPGSRERDQCRSVCAVGRKQVLCLAGRPPRRHRLRRRDARQRCRAVRSGRWRPGSALPLVPQLVKLTAGIDAGGDPWVATHPGTTSRDHHLAIANQSHRSLVTWAKSWLAHRLDGKRHLVLGRNVAHAFTLSPRKVKDARVNTRF